MKALRPHLVPFIALLFLLTLTAAGAFLPLGYGNLVLALFIGGFKTTIVFVFFMDLRRENMLIRLTALVGLLWLTLFLMLVLTDHLTRFPGISFR